MPMIKSALAAALAGGAAVALSATALATTATSATATATPATTPTPAATLTPAPAAGPLTISLVCDTGPGGAGTFSVTANAKTSTVSVKCGKTAAVSNAAWKAGSTAVIHQTAATASGQLRATDVKVALKAAGETVAIRNFRSAAVASVATLAQTGAGVPAVPLGPALGGLLLVAIGARTVMRKAAQR